MIKPTIIITKNDNQKIISFLTDNQIDYEVKYSDEKFSDEEIFDLKLSKILVQGEKLTAQLEDGREWSIPIAWFSQWGAKSPTPEQLTNYEIFPGNDIYFPDIDEVLGLEKFIYGFNAPCQ